MSCEEPMKHSIPMPLREEKVIEETAITEKTVPIIEPVPPKPPQAQPEPPQVSHTANNGEQPAPQEKKDISQAPRCINKMIRTTRKPAYTSSLLTQADIAQEIIARAEKKRQTFPDAVDVFVALKSQSQIRVPNLTNEVQPLPMPVKLPKIRDEDKCLDAKELLLILQDGIDGNSGDQKLKTGPKARSSRPKLDLKIDPDLERELALKQLMEFSSKKEKKSKNTNNNVDNVKTSKAVKQEKGENKEVKPKRKSTNSSNGPPPKRGSNRELQRLLQDEGAINMLYDIERGESAENKSRLSSKRRLQKVLKKKAQEVEEAILVATSSTSISRSLRTSDKRKHSVDSVELDEPQDANTQFTFTAPAEASKIIRRHSSSSSYSSRGSSPRRMSVDRDQSPSSSESSPLPTPNDSKPHQPSLAASPAPRTLTPLKTVKIETTPEITDTLPVTLTNTNPRVKISERTEKLIEMKVRELNLQPHHGALIKQLILEKKNGLRERLQSEFAVKFKAALPKDQANTVARSAPQSPGFKLNEGALAQLKEKTKNLVNSVESPSAIMSKPAWKMVEEDWDSGEEGDPDCLPLATTPEKLPTLEKSRVSKSLEANINTIAETLVARIKAALPLGAETVGRSHTKGSTPALIKSEYLELEERKLRMEPRNLNETMDQIDELALLPVPMPGPVPGSDVRLERINTVIRLYIKPTSCRLPNSLNCKVLNELTQALDYLQSSTDTRVIVLVFPPLHDAMTAVSDSENDLEAVDVPDISSEPAFPAFRSDIVEALPTDQINHCNGIDLLSLCAESAEERRQIASETAAAIKDLTLKLATCTRLVCTAVCGKAIGLSVVLLAYCDFVLADETAVFFTPYSQLGYLPEAAGTHVLPHLIGKRKTSWLLLGNGSLTAKEAEVCGLITRVVARKSLAHELNNLGQSLANTSMLASESAKGMMNQSIRSSIPNFLATEAKVLETHWSAPDTQHRMKNFAAQLIEESQRTEWNGREHNLRESEERREEQESAPDGNFVEVPLQNLVFEDESSNTLKVEPLQPIDELHFEDTTILELPRDDGEYKIQLLR